MGRILNTARKRRLLASPGSLTPLQRASVKENVVKSAMQAIDDLHEILNSDNEGVKKPVEQYMSKICENMTESVQSEEEKSEQDKFWDGTIEL